METEYNGTIKTKEDFDPETAAKQFKKALKGIGTDENLIIRLLVSHSSLQRQEIKEKYKTMYGQDLIDDLKDELGGHFEEAVVAMLISPNDLLVGSLHDALEAVPTDDRVLIDILCCRTPDELESLREFYQNAYDKSLDEALEEEVSGPLENLLRGLVASGRDEDLTKDAAKARKDAQDLYDAGVGMNNDSDESEFIRIMNTRSYPQLQEVFKAYEEIAQDTIENAIESEFDGDMKDGLLAIVQRVNDPLAFYASRIYAAFDGAGTDDKNLIRTLVSRSEIDLHDVAGRYKEMYNKELFEAIKEDTSGDYGKLLMAIVKGE